MCGIMKLWISQHVSLRWARTKIGSGNTWTLSHPPRPLLGAATGTTFFRVRCSPNLRPSKCTRSTASVSPPPGHFVAHYYLYRAMPTNPIAYLSFLKMASVERLSNLVQSGYDEALIRSMSLEYERIRSGAAALDGWLHIYKGKHHTVVPADFLAKMLAKGWTQDAPPRQWVHKDEESRRIPVDKVQEYLERGFALGRPAFHTPEGRNAVSKKTSVRHQREAAKGEEAYLNLPRGDQHRRRVLGCPPEVAEKISRTLAGRPPLASHPIGRGISIAKGKHWTWSEEARKRRSESMKGKKPTNGLTMEGKKHSEESKLKSSESHKEFYANNHEGVVALDAVRPRGEDHWTYGKGRTADTRAKIARSLTGKKHSEETRRKMSASHKARIANEIADSSI